MTMPPSAGDSTTCGAERADAVGDRRAAGLGLARMLQHQRALQIPGAVQPGRQPEVSFEQRADAAEPIENGIGSN